MYYGIVIISVLMFGIQFYLNDKYQKESGSDIGSSLLFSFISSLAGVICLAAINGFDFSFTPFTIVWAAVSAITFILYTVCTLKALQRINLSVYSLFSMLGGMILPFLAGIIFYNESLTVAKVLCLLSVSGALLITVSPGKRTGGEIYYLGVFVLNGLYGVLSKVYEESAFNKTSAGGYSLWVSIISALITGIGLIALCKDLKLTSIRSVLYSAGGGALNRIANLLLLISLAFLPASVQYPFVTGGVIIVSTLIAALTKQKPSKREIFAVCLSFAGLLALVLIPI